MQLGIFARTFPGSTPLGVLSAARRAGYAGVQYNMACSGPSPLPTHIDAATAEAVREAARRSGVEIIAVSATYNMVHPDMAVRHQGRAAFAAIAGAARDIGTNLLTVCSGSLDAQDQWRHHPGNATKAAWADMCCEFALLLAIAETQDIYIGIEPELANVVSSAAKARSLLDTFNSDRLRIVLDPANLFEVETASRRAAIIDAAVELLADQLVMAHAKDRDASGGFATAGHGVIDFGHFLRALHSVGFAGPLVTHGLRADEAPGVAGFLQQQMAQLP